MHRNLLLYHVPSFYFLLKCFYYFNNTKFQIQSNQLHVPCYIVRDWQNKKRKNSVPPSSSSSLETGLLLCHCPHGLTIFCVIYWLSLNKSCWSGILNTSKGGVTKEVWFYKVENRDISSNNRWEKANDFVFYRMHNFWTKSPQLLQEKCIQW